MRRRPHIAGPLCAAALLLGSFTGAGGDAGRVGDAGDADDEPTLADLPGHFRNLQVLPEDISKQELFDTMKTIARALGVKCNHCHDTAANDFASDDLEEKRIAREMLRMVRRIDRELFSWPDAPTPTCFMCHHGQREPRLAP